MKTLILHHSGISRKEVWYQTWAINRAHRMRFNLKSVLGFFGGYTYTIDPSGNLVQYRKDYEEGMHTIGHNIGTIGICLQGNFLKERPTEKQLTTLRKLIDKKRIVYGDVEIKLHKELQKDRICPCFSRDYLETEILRLHKTNNKEEQKERAIKNLTSQLDYIRSILLSLRTKYNL